MLLDLAVVMPVYNEEQCIAEVVRSWQATLSEVGINFRIIVLNDGSSDGTREALATFAGNREVEVIHKANSGHGPTILQGYRKASQLADWVFQCDSDDEIRAEHFPVFWRKREHFDGLFGVRVGRRQGLARSVISLCSRTIVRCLFGQAVLDVNTPYRLMRANLLRPIVERIPADTFAPNVLISGVLAKARLRILNLAVPHECRQTGSVSLVKRRLFRAVLKSFRQTLYCRALTGTIVSEFGAGAMSKAHDETQ